MSYSEEFAARIRKILSPQTQFIEKQMFGGVAFMVDDKMCVGISRDKHTGDDRLMARVGPDFHHEALKQPGCREMDFAGKAMTGFVFVHPEGYTSEDQLRFWITKTLEFNRLAPVKPVKKRALLAPKEKAVAKVAKPALKKTPAKAVKIPAKSKPAKAAKTVKPAGKKKKK